MNQSEKEKHLDNTQLLLLVPHADVASRSCPSEDEQTCAFYNRIGFERNLNMLIGVMSAQNKICHTVLLRA